MFTTKEITQAQNEARSFINQCEEFRALLVEHELPMSFDLEKLKGVLRAQLFAKLLAVDKGLKMRFEMLRTEEAQQKLVADTIDLSGYTIVDNLGRLIAQLQQGWSRLQLRRGRWFCQPERDGVSLNTLATAHNLDFNQWLQSREMDWRGKEHVLAYFEELGKTLAQVRALHRATRDSGASLAHTFGPAVANYFTEASNTGPVAPDEHWIMGELIPTLERKGMLASFPGCLK
ncbi:hypothetical protein E5K00_06050 [Hymenobacter aquaticus]|uniref:Uncharacterized protein n=1 Tax=Hymenobacter aquaticus TaxID=1867101 RepID=A0A4Z0Q407_9BACT|nr:hypothetical protein [Hymenobacter aquaticus]TGE24767.1 hypothetical protein E5K00_06050 [Hymenobacter aquaticus]